MTPFILVIGPAQNGKSTFRRCLARVLGVKGASCSDHLYALWSLLDGRRGPELLKELPKEEARDRLVRLGNWLTTEGPTDEGFPFDAFPDADTFPIRHLLKRHPAALIQEAYQNNVRVLDGVRRRVELEAALPAFEWFGHRPLIIWVEDPRKPRLESDNLDILPSVADRIVINDGSVEDLEDAAFRIAREFFGKGPEICANLD